MPLTQGILGLNGESVFRRVLKSFLTIAIATVLSVSQVPAFAAPAAPSAPFKPQMSAPTSSVQTEIVVTWLAPLDNAVAHITGQLDQLRSGAKVEKFAMDGSKPEAKPAAADMAAQAASVRLRAGEAPLRCAGEPAVGPGIPLHGGAHPIAVPEIDVIPHPNLVSVIQDRAPG